MRTTLGEEFQSRTQEVLAIKLDSCISIIVKAVLVLLAGNKGNQLLFF